MIDINKIADDADKEIERVSEIVVRKFEEGQKLFGAIPTAVSLARASYAEGLVYGLQTNGVIDIETADAIFYELLQRGPEHQEDALKQ